MAQRTGVAALIFMLVATCAAAQQPPDKTAAGEQFVGTWSGTWDSGGSGGGFELTFEKATDGAVTGRVSVTGEPTYKATLKSLSFDGNKMTGAYDFTPDEAAEVLLSGTFEGKTAKGTWSLRAKADKTEVASGTWTVTNK